MGLFSFVQSAGAKLFGKAEEAPQAAPAGNTGVMAANKGIDRDAQIGKGLTAAVLGFHLDVQDLAVTFADGTATITGKARTQADQEKAVLIVGNHQFVGTVDDQLQVLEPEPPALFHTVVAGDSLSKISLANYGVIHLYDAIFEANKPMLAHPDEIFPGQVLRIPRQAAATHTVAKGETLGTIAKHWYGKPARYTDIFEANRDVLSDPNRVEVGQQLKIPVSGPAAAK